VAAAWLAWGVVTADKRRNEDVCTCGHGLAVHDARTGYCKHRCDAACDLDGFQLDVAASPEAAPEDLLTVFDSLDDGLPDRERRNVEGTVRKVLHKLFGLTIEGLRAKARGERTTT
jgi:hypothetical protein